MLKIKDKRGETVMVLKDDACSPEPIKDEEVQEEHECDCGCDGSCEECQCEEGDK